MDRPGLAEFLRRRRDALQPEDVGLPRGSRRRTEGLRREEVAALCHMSTDYYARLERGTGPRPSEQMMAAIAQGLHLGLAGRDHAYRLAGHAPPARGPAAEQHVSPGLLRVLDRLDDTPAEIVTELGETLRQTRLGSALLGDASTRQGSDRSIGHRWFTDAAARAAYPPDEQEALSRVYAAGLRELVTLRGPGSRAAAILEGLLDVPLFRSAWDAHEVGLRPPSVKRFVHPAVGELQLSCQTLLDPDQSHRLLVYTAEPGSASAEALHLLAVLAGGALARA